MSSIGYDRGPVGSPDSSTDRSSDPVVSVLVVSYNTHELTLAACRSVEEQTTVPFELLVADNASTDGSAEALMRMFPDHVIRAEHENHGFARANNLLANDAGGKYLLLLNPDTVVLDHAIDRLVEFAERTPSAKIWGGRTLFGDGSLNPANCWRKISVGSTLCRVLGLDTRYAASPRLNAEGYGGWDRSDEREVDIVSGCFLLIEADLWRELGGFDPMFEMYGEEADLCLRARDHGARPRITPEATIVHHGGASESVRSQKHIRLLRAKITLADRHMSPGRAWMTKMLLRSWPLTRWVAAELMHRVHPTGGSDHLRTNWCEVWSERSRWWHGYGPVDEAHADEERGRVGV